MLVVVHDQSVISSISYGVRLNDGVGQAMFQHYAIASGVADDIVSQNDAFGAQIRLSYHVKPHSHVVDIEALYCDANRLLVPPKVSFDPFGLSQFPPSRI